MSRFIVRPAGRVADGRPARYEIVDTSRNSVIRAIPENPGDGSTPSTRGQALTHAGNLNGALNESTRTRHPCPKGCGQYFPNSTAAGEHTSLKCDGIYREKG